MDVGEILSTVSGDYQRYIKQSDIGNLENNIRKGGSGGSFGNISDADYDCLLFFNDDLPLFHELPYRVLLHLPGLLTRLGVVQVTYDHYHYWAWTAEVFREINRENQILEEDVERFFLLAVDNAIGSLGSAPVTDRLRDVNRQLEGMVSPHTKRAMRNSHRTATQLSHPLLEGMLRRLCSDFVELNGMVKSGQKILKMDDSERSGGRANNIGNLLYHYENRVADIETAASMNALRNVLERYSDNENGFEIINSWRHPHSHGGERLSGSEFAVLLNIVSLLIWGVIEKEDYMGIDEDWYSQKILNRDPFSSLSPFDYYPLKETRDLLISKNRDPSMNL